MRGVIVTYISADDPADFPLEELAYRTPRFPDGIRGSELARASEVVQRETTLIWFLANYERPQGPFFEFAEAQADKLNAQPSASDATHDGMRRRGGSLTFRGEPVTFKSERVTFDGEDLNTFGFGQGPFFSGGDASGFIRAEFGGVLDEVVLSQISEALPGQWVLRQDNAPVPGSTEAEMRQRLAAAIEHFAEAVHNMPASRPSRLDNHPPEAINDETDDEVLGGLTVQERNGALRATESMRAALSSYDYDMLARTWETVAPTVRRVSAAIARYADIYFMRLASGKADLTAAAIPGLLLHATGIINAHEAIGLSLKVLIVIRGAKAFQGEGDS
jgi:hypothetical protein